jgi:protein O-GlcNAc transferase
LTQIIKSNQITNKYYLLALTNFEKKDFKLAKFHFLEYLKKNDDFQALNLLGICYLNLKEYIAAAKVFKELISKKIINDSILNNYGVALKNLKELNTAKYYFKKSIKINQKNFLAFFNLGNLIFEIGKEKEAEILFLKCIKLRKSYLPAIINLSMLYLKNYNLDKCLKLLKNSLNLFPNNNTVIENIAKIYLIRKNFNLAEKYLIKLIQLSKENIKKIIPLALGYCYEGKEKEYKKICRLYTKNLTKDSSIFSLNTIKKKIPTISFLSPDIRNHPVGFFTKDMLPELSKRFKIIIFNTCEFEDEISIYTKNFCHWINLKTNNEYEIADAIFKKNVDVLIDSSGLTRTNNLGVFKLKPSKNQVSWAGWLASTNLKEMDYVISDHFCTRQKDEKFFTEKVLRMKNIWCTYSLSVLENLNLKKKYNSESFIIYGCFQRPEKISKKVLRTWTEILIRVKKSKIFFINQSFNEYEKKKLISHFNNNCISNKRLIFIQPKNRKEYLNSYNLVDINLDTFPYNGGTTLFESSYMGVPTLTKENNSFMFRCGESINNNLNMQNWIAKNTNDYVNKAEDFSNKKFVNELKRKLIIDSNKSILFNSKVFANEFGKLIMNIL